MWDLVFNSLSGLLQPVTLALMLGSCFLGLVFGALPGLNATMAVAIILPLTFTLDTNGGLAVLICAYIGGVSGGLVSAILMRIPGTPSSVATTFDGFPLAQKGQAVKALGTAIIASFFGTLFSFTVLVIAAPVISRFALKFGPFEYASLATLALTLVGVLSKGNVVKGLIAALLGIAISLIGFAPIDGSARFTFGTVAMSAGVALVPFMVGLFAISQLIQESLAGVREVKLNLDIKGLGVTLREVKDNIVNILRSCVIGIGIGILPGIGGAASNLVAYATAKQSSKHPEKFGTGVVEGIWASESSNNASIGGALLPLITLGIPGDGVTAMLIGGFMIHGLQPGPMLYRETPDVVAGIYAAYIVAAVMVFCLQLFTIRPFPRVLLTPRHFLIPILFLLASIGAYGSDNRIFDIGVMLVIGVIGYFLERYRFPLGPMVLGFVMGPILEQNLRRALMYSDGEWMPFLTQPIAAVCVGLTVISLAYGIWQNVKPAKL